MKNPFAVLAKPILTPDVEPKASASQFTMNVVMLPRKMDQDTDIGGPNHRFPVTQHSAIIAARSQDRQVRERAFATILESYWKPAYKYIRIKWQAGNEDAKDLNQSIFPTPIEKDHFA